MANITKDNYYQFSDTELMREYRKTQDAEMKSFLCERLLSRFEYDYTQKPGETKEELFGRIMGSWVNGKMGSARKVAEKMATEHRYLQNELFWMFFEYCKVLAENYDNKYYDARNQSACKFAKVFVNAYNDTINSYMDAYAV